MGAFVCPATVARSARVERGRRQAIGLDGVQHVARGGIDILGRAPALVEEGLEGGGERRVGNVEAAHAA